MCKYCNTPIESIDRHGDVSGWHHRPFNYDHAKAGAPISNLGGGVPVILTFTRQGPRGQKFPILVEDITGATVTYDLLGRRSGSTTWNQDDPWKLVMRPLAYVDGSPVFVGDELQIIVTGNTYYASIGDIGFDIFNQCTWPKKYPETRMSDAELFAVSKDMRSFANAVIRRAVDDGDVTMKE